MQNIDHREQTQIPLISSEQNITTNISTTKDGYEGEGFGNPDERALKNNDQHEHHHRSRRNNKWKYAFVGLLALNVVGLANRVQQMHRKREWCREHPQKCEFFKQKHAMRYGRDPAASMPGMFVDFFFPPPPHWMHKFDNKNNDNNDSDWEKNFRVAGETPILKRLNRLRFRTVGGVRKAAAAAAVEIITSVLAKAVIIITARTMTTTTTIVIMMTLLSLKPPSTTTRSLEQTRKKMRTNFVLSSRVRARVLYGVHCVCITIPKSKLFLFLY
jgi:hypothetical protein